MRFCWVVAVICLQPAAAWACGGFFCNNATPVVQSAERIVFIPHEGKIHMHVRITYSGPRDDFGWLLPATPGVEVKLSTEMVFDALDNRYAPQFNIVRVFDPECAQPQRTSFARGAAGGPESANSADPGVTVVSRQAVGPYDNVILQAETVQALRDWLDENEFQIPPAIDDKLGPYVDVGAHFVAIKLRAGQDTGDIAPLYLAFDGETPAIPIVPTSVAANPDMGVLVQILGDERAVPKNYLHVQINEGALDLNNGGLNYVDVVSQAVDEAGGKAFVTDFAGAVDDGFRFQIQPIEAERFGGNIETLADLLQSGLWNDPDFQRVGKDIIGLPDGAHGEFEGDEYWDCAGRYAFRDNFGGPGAGEHPCGIAPQSVDVDWAALEMRIDTEINPAREHLVEMTTAHPYLTRLYSTMSPDEMTLDPEFMFNGDLDDKANFRTIEVRIPCDGEQPDLAGATLVNAAGMAVDADLTGDSAVVRMDGATVQGMETPAAAVIERPMAAGPSEVVGMMGQMMGPTPDQMMGLDDTRSGSLEDDDDFGDDTIPGDPMGMAAVSTDGEPGGCYGCNSQGRNTDSWAMLALVFLGFTCRRRRVRA